jgi:glycyl-tRNA synthetase beta chain
VDRKIFPAERGCRVSLPFLLEIGTEEIPDWMIVPALNNLQDMFQALLDQRTLGGRVTSVDATPRRLVLRAEHLLERQIDAEEIVLGPYKSAGPGAAAGFAKKWGTTPDQLGTHSTPKGEQLLAVKRTQGQPTSEILARELPHLILKIPWPKTMVWNGKGTERFIRPIRWLVALLGDAIVPFEIGGVKSGNTTRGHRILGKASISVTIEDFDEQLRTNGVILSATERREKIESGIAALHAKPDPDLLHTLVYITEFPTPIVGTFDRSYLDLPKEVLTTVMRHHQKYLSVEDADGKLAPHFIAVMNTNADPDGLVRHGNERVLRARFNDARFFWDQDQKKMLEDRVEDLKAVTFQAKLGSYYDKAQRIVAIVRQLGAGQSAERAALLCKCDLTTDMVKEFTDLQGIVGGLYANAQGEPDDVARAIYDHYKPLSMEDEIPTTLVGCNVALADKIDSLRECFRVGLVPTGSRDPFALRRAAQGVIRILDQRDFSLEIKLYLGDQAELHEFFLDRVRHYFREIRRFAYDEVNAAVAAGWDNLLDLRHRLTALKDIRPVPDFQAVAANFKRIKNILKQAEYTPDRPAISEHLLEGGPERDLFDAFQDVRREFAPFKAAYQYSQALHRIASLRPAVDLFFDKVLVNAPDPNIRRNRLALLYNLLQEFSTIADFSEIVTERQS